MGVFSRIGEILNSNIMAMLDKAEDPIKMVKLMIHDMEDTLMEIKSAAAEVIAEEKRLKRSLRSLDEKSRDWEAKAELAVSRGRDDLAREALEQKLNYNRKSALVEDRLKGTGELVEQYRSDILRLEEKLQGARMRQASLEERSRRQQKRKLVEQHIYRVQAGDAFGRFERFESQIDRFEADADVASMSNEGLDRQFEDLEQEGEVERELEALKKKGRPAKRTKNS